MLTALSCAISRTSRTAVPNLLLLCYSRARLGRTATSGSICECWNNSCRKRSTARMWALQISGFSREAQGRPRQHRGRSGKARIFGDARRCLRSIDNGPGCRTKAQVPLYPRRLGKAHTFEGAPQSRCSMHISRRMPCCTSCSITKPRPEEGARDWMKVSYWFGQSNEEERQRARGGVSIRRFGAPVSLAGPAASMTDWLMSIFGLCATLRIAQTPATCRIHYVHALRCPP